MHLPICENLEINGRFVWRSTSTLQSIYVLRVHPIDFIFSNVRPKKTTDAKISPGLPCFRTQTNLSSGYPLLLLSSSKHAREKIRDKWQLFPYNTIKVRV